MRSKRNKEKIDIEKCRLKYAKYYSDEIEALKLKIRELEKQNKSYQEVVSEQGVKLKDCEEQLNLYRMVFSDAVATSTLDKIDALNQLRTILHISNKFN